MNNLITIIDCEIKKSLVYKRVNVVLDSKDYSWLISSKSKFAQKFKFRLDWKNKLLIEKIKICAENINESFDKLNNLFARKSRHLHKNYKLELAKKKKN